MKKKRAERYVNEGVLALRGRDPNLALERFLKALKDDPENPYVHYNIAIAYWAKRDTAKAKLHFEEAIRLKPGYSEAYNNLGVIYLEQGQIQQAIESFKKALSNPLYSNPQDAHYNLGRAYLKRKEYGKAILQLKQAVQIIPEFASAYNSLGEAYQGMNMLAEAEGSYRKALNYAPEYAKARLNLGRLLYQQRRFSEARQAFVEVMRQAPASNEAEEARSYLQSLP
ncbi:MAG: tetratricopeptide repeat protein [Deltaproteobacteria bacterium]|nr:tetratricopeptide repeat protein [Deltaproteobacteria bacterium]MBW2072272.1 tetratricopeptide repeat protein [Deltaproteobacteria bacterium]